MSKRYLAILSVLVASCDSAQQLKTASGHPIQYYLSLPDGWSASRKWPVVIVIESANRDFQATAEVFAKARQKMPFILATPLVVTNGGANYRGVPTYRYSDDVWNEIQRDTCRFDMDGLAAVAADVRKLYVGEDTIFLTGWEAGGHTIWSMIFQHPELLRAAALSGPNYQGRCLAEGSFSTAPARVNLPVRVFQGETSNQYPAIQFEAAKKDAEAHGYRNVTRSVVAGKPHGPLADEILAYFQSLIQP